MAAIAAGEFQRGPTMARIANTAADRRVKRQDSTTEVSTAGTKDAGIINMRGAMLKPSRNTIPVAKDTRLPLSFAFL